jgi:hypothetical protein
MGTGSFPGVERPGRDADPSPPYSAAEALLSLRVFVDCKKGETYLPFKDEAQTALFKDPVRTAH